MSPFASPTAIPHGTTVPARPQPRLRLRNVLHLLMALSMWLSTVSPLLVPAQPALANTVDWSARKVAALPAALPAASTRPPYRAGMEPAAGAQASAPADSAAEEQAGTPALQVLGTELAPDWLRTDAGAGQAGTPALQSAELTPDWLEAAADEEQAGTPALQSLDADLALLPLAELFALTNDATIYQAGTCVLGGLEIAGATPLSVVQGDVTTPYTFTTVISNTGYLASTGALSLTLQTPPNFYFVGNSATARSSVSGTLSVVQPLLNLAAGVPAVVVVRASPTSATLPLGDVIAVTYRLAAATGGEPNPTLSTSLAISGGLSACSLAQTISTSLCPLPVRLPMQLQPPPYLVSRGNFAGDLYTVTVRNTGTTTATDISFEVDPSTGFFFKGNSALGGSTQYGTLAVQQPLADTPPGSPFVLTVAETFPTNSLAPGATAGVVFRLGTDADAKSGQPLSVTLRSGAAAPQVCNGTRENIATARGNLIVTKGPEVQTARLGDVVTWTVSLRNTGLGSVYDVAFDDAPGPGVRLLSITPPVTTTAEIRPDQSVLYTVTGEISACTGLRNTGLGHWSIGNIDATGLLTNPVSDDAFISYLFEDPAVTVTVEPLGDLQFCGQTPRTVVVTVTNGGGPAEDLLLEVQQSGSFTLTPQGTDWVQAGDVLSYTAHNGVLPSGATITFPLTVNFTAPVCEQNNGSFVLRPLYRSACPAGDPPARGAQAEVSLQSEEAPTLSIEKIASTQIAAPGDTVFYTVTVSGRNPISTAIGPIHITDTLPPIFNGGTAVRSDSLAAELVDEDRFIETIITPTTTPWFTESLYISATIPPAGVCGGGAPQINRVRAHAESCEDCLSDSDYHNLYVADPGPGGAGGGYFRLTSNEVNVCGPEMTQQTVAISVSDGITWTGSSYYDGLNVDGNVGPLNVVPGTVRVTVDDVDRTGDVTITTTPALQVKLDNIGSFSETALITITYAVTAGETAAAGEDIYFVHFVQGGYANPYACGVTRYAPVSINIERATLDNLRVEPAALNACSENTVELTVDGTALDAGVTDQIVVTFTADAGDVITLTEPYLQLGGGFAGQSVETDVGEIGGSRLVTFTFDPGLDIDQPGTISFPLYRRCGVETPLGARLSYADACRLTKTDEISGGLTTRQSNLLLRAPEITYTLDTDSFTWQFSVRNSGDMTATNVLVTNTLPFGVHYRTLARSGVEQDYLDAIETAVGTVNAGIPGQEREVVSFTVPVFPPNSSIQFVGNGEVQTCNASDSLWIRLTQPCGGVGNTCGGSQMARLGVQQGRGALLTSNTQQATIPLCSAGDVRLIVKNASGQTDLYDFVVRQALTDVTYAPDSAHVQLVRADGTVSPFVPFTPTNISPQTPVAPFRQTLEWNAAAMDSSYPPEVRALLEQRGPSDQLIIEFSVRTYCSATSPAVGASVQANNICSTVFRGDEDSHAVEVAKPALSLQKQVRNVTTDGSFASRVLAGSGDTLVWKLDVSNSSAVDVSALHLTDTLPAWFQVEDIYTTPATLPPVVQWKIYSGTGTASPVPAQTVTTFWITGTVGQGACTDTQNNVAAAAYGCAAGDICPSPSYSATAGVNTAPAFSVAAADATFDQCGSGPLVVTFANTGARSGAAVVTYTLPSGYKFGGLAAGTTPTPTYTPTVGATGVITFGYAAIDQQQVTNTLRINVTRDLAAEGACLNSATVTATLGYADSCGGWHGNAANDTGRLTVQRSNLSSLMQTPVLRTIVVGELYTWTVAVTNTGSGATNNMVMTSTLDEGLAFYTATVGSSDSVLVTPTYGEVGGHSVVTWEVGSLPAGEKWTAEVSAYAVAEKRAYRITAETHTACGDGGCEQAVSAASYAAPLQSLSKRVSADKVSIGEPFTYTLTADFFGSVTYTDTQLVDLLPELDGRLVFSYTNIEIANTNSAQNVWSADTATPGRITFTTAGGDVIGRDALTIRIGGLISNDVAAQQGVAFTNSLSLGFFYDGVNYHYSAEAPAVVKEPALGIRKTVTPTAGVRAGSTVTYTLVVTHALASDATAYNVIVTDSVPPILTYNAGSLQVSALGPGTVVSATVGNSLAITVSEYPTPAAPIYITYTAAPNGDMQPSSRYTNTAFVRYTSQGGENPYDRDGSGVTPNDYWGSSSAAFTSTAVSIDKALLSDLDYTIGDFITYTVWITLPTGTTRNLSVTDTVPAGLLYQAPTSTLAVSATEPITLSYAITPSSGNGTTASQAILRLLEPVYNTTGAPAVITWTMRLLAVNDSGRTINYNGAAKTNTITTTNINEVGQLQTITDSAAAARIYEPLLHIGKEYVTAQMCSARLLADNFNGGSIADWTIVSGTWSAANGWLRAPSTTALLIHGPDAWSDVSYSAVFSTTDGTGSVGLIFRGQNANNYYRFVWTNTGSYQVVKVTGGSEQQALSQAGSGFIANRWYHLEIRSIGRTHEVYIDGQRVLTYTDNTAGPFLTGSVGFYAAGQNGLAFDDALVTRVGDAGCLVDANDLVTYTLTISNQGRLTGHDLVITDVLPLQSLQYITYSMTSSDPGAVVTAEPTPGSTGTVVWQVNQLTPPLPFNPLAHSTLVLTVTGRVLGDVSAGVRLPNQALLAYDGQAGSGPAGVERAYSGGSHSTGVRTPAAELIKTTAPTTVTIGERLHYTLTLPGSGGLPATLYTATVTDALPSGFRLAEPPAVSWEPSDALTPADVDTTRSTSKTVLVDFTRVPSGTEVTVAITGVVENILANQDGVSYTNTATLGWRDVTGEAVTPLTSNPVTTTLAEPHLIIEKLAAPKGVRPGDTVFFRIRVYHAATSTVSAATPAYNVVITDVIPPELRYISGSWPRDNEPLDVANSGTYSETGDTLQVFFPVISTTLTADNPLELTFQGVVDINARLGSLITNVVTTTWQSLPADPDGERRDGSGGSGGVNDYRSEADASVSLDSFSLVKTGPLTAVAGSAITYVVNLYNSSAITGHNATVNDRMPFQVQPITATFAAPLRSGACDPPTVSESRPLFSCRLGDLPPYSSAVITLTGIIDPHTPDGSLIDNYATATLIDSNGNLKTLEDEAETWIDTEADLSIKKTGPITAMAGDLITYTVVVSNAGPSQAHGVDVKDALPPGVTFVSGSATQGACASAICQLGEVEPDVPVTVVITATVGPGVSGLITNTAYVFAATTDKNTSNNSSASTSVVGANTALHVAKTDFTDPVYAGNTYLYQIGVTNTGPATAFGVVVTDTLPAGAAYEGSSPGCAYAAGKVTCIAGDMLPGSWFGFLINVRVPATITDGTLVTNHVSLTTTTNILTAASTLTDSEPTTWLQAVGSPTDLAISKKAAGSPTLAGSGAPITYTLNVTNNGPAPATAVQVSDLFPPQFQLMSIQTSRPLTQAQCSSGGVCDLGDLAVGQSAVVTLVMQAPANAAAGIYTNTAFVGSPAIDSNPANNTASVGVTVNTQAVLQARKAANPNPTIAGESLSYVIFITNTGPSNANNVTVSDTLPAGFSPALIVSSQGSCAALPCNIGMLPPRSSAWVQIYGTVLSTVTQAAQLANTAAITATEYPTGVTASVTLGLASRTSLLVNKTQAAPVEAVAAGGLVTYTIVVTNSGPGLAHSVDVKDQLPSGLSLASVAAESGVCAGALCQFGSLPAGASRTMTVVAQVDPAQAAGIVTNTAAAFSPDAPVVSKTVATAITTTANLRISKGALNSPVNAGEVLLYQIVVSNEGPSDARSVTVTDSLPAGLTYTGGDSTCAANGSEVVCAVGALPAGSARTLLIGGRAAIALANGLQLTNVVTASSPTAAQPVTATAAAVVHQPTGSPADLSLRKSGPITATAGELLRYTLTVTNSGPAAAAAVNVLDVLPAGVNFVAAAPSQGLCERGISCQLGELGVGATATVLITGLVQSGVLSGALLVNTAQVGSSSPDPNPLDNSSSFTTTAHALARLTISKDANAANVLVGEQVQYRIVVTNSGPSTAQDVVVQDALPADFANPLVSSSQGPCRSFPCALGSLAPGAAATILVVGTAAANGPLYNSASVSGSTALDPQSVLTAAALVTVNPYADLALIKDASPTAIAGGQVVYTLTAVNNGPSAAQFITVTDALPAQTTFAGAQASSPAGSCTHSSGVVTCHLDTLAAGAQASFTITATTAADITEGSSIENRAAVAAWTLDPAPANNSDRADTSIIAQAQLAISKQASADTITAGDQITYTIAVTNSGPSAAADVDVKDQLPPGLTLANVQADRGVCAGPLCQFGSLPAGASRTMTVVAEVDPTLPAATLTNLAAAASPDAQTVTDTVTTTVDTAAALRISKTALNSPVKAGEVLFYQIVVGNDGPSDAQSVTVTDTLPAGATYAGGDRTCTANGSEVVCAIGALPAGAERALLVNVTVAANLPDGTTLTNIVTAASPTAPEPVTDSVDTVVRQPQGGAADLAVSKLGLPQVTAGEEITYSLLVTNSGPSAAQNVLVVDALPLSVTLIGVTPSQGACAAGVTCQLGELGAGMTATVLITGVVQSGVLSGALLVNTAQVGSSNPDADPLNNRAGFTTTVDSLVLLSVHKQATVETVAPGGSLTYRVVVTNTGPSTARGVVMTDLLPADLLSPLLSSSRGSCSATACTLGDLLPGDTVTILVLGSVSPFAGGSLTNTAQLTTTSPLDPASVLEDTVVTPISNSADLVLAKTATPSVFAGQRITYVLSVYNAGPSAATVVQVLDQLPLSTTLAELDAACTVANGGQTAIRCPQEPEILQAGDSLTYTVVVTSDAALATGSVLQNRAEVTSDTPDPNGVNNRATANTSIAGRADLHVSKSADPAGVLAGELLTYTVVITNSGPSDANTVRLVDVLPPEVAQIGPVGAERSISLYPITCLNLVCEIGAMPLDEVITLTVPVRVHAAVADNTTFTNTATVYSPSDYDPADNVGQAAATARRQSTLAISKTADPTPAVTGAELLYTIRVTNLGPSDAGGVVVSDTLPAGFTLTAISSSQGDCAELPCSLGVLPAGGAASVLLRGQVSPTQGEALVNSAAVTAATPLTDSERSRTTITTPVTSAADLQLILESTPTAIAGMTATVYANVVNHGPSSAVGAVVTITLPPGATFDSAQLPSGWSATPWPDGQVALTTSGTLLPGAQIPLTLTVGLSPDIAGGSSIEFTGVVTSDTPDPTPSNNTDTADTSVLAQAQLTIAKRPSLEVLTAGELVTYTIEVGNEGPSTATSVDVKDQLPPGLGLISAEVEGGVCGGPICQFRSLPAGATRTMTVVVEVNPALPGGFITNTAAAFSPDAPTVTDTVTSAVDTRAGLEVIKTALNDPVAAGGLQSYQIVVRNAGPSDAEYVLIEDPLPHGTTYSGGDPLCAGDEGNIICWLGTLPAGAERSLLVNVTVDADLPDGTILTNIVTATSPTAAEPVTDSVDTVVRQPQGGAADLAVSKLGLPQVTAGEEITYSLLVTNSGPAAAQNVQIVDALPLSVTLTGVTPSQGTCENGISCQLGELGVGATATVLITGLVQSDVLSGALLVNTAQVGSSNPDPNPLDNSSSFTTTAHALARLTISKDANAVNVLVGEQVQYRIVVTNSGPSTAQDVVVQDALPADLLNPLVSSSQGPCRSFPCALGSLAPGAAATILVVGTAAANGPLYNSASVAGSTALDPQSVLTDAALVTVNPYADLALIKDASPTAIAGGQVVYTLTAVNNGPSAAQFITVTDALPAQTTFAGAQASSPAGSCTHSGGVVTCHLDTLAAGAQASFTITATAAADIIEGSSIENRAAVAAWTLDPAPANNSDRADTSIIAHAQLAIAKRASADNVTAGDQITYTIIVTNSGPSTAADVDVKDQLPPGLTLANVQADRGVCAGTLCQFGSLPAGASRTMTVVAQVDPSLPAAALTNLAAAASPDAQTVTDTVTTTVDNRVLLHINKTASAETVTPGDLLTYNIVVANSGPSTARDVVVTDLLPAELLNPSLSSSRGSCSAAACALGDLAPGDTVTILVLGSISPAAAGSITNTAQVATTSPLDPGSVLDDTVVTPINSLADVMVAKTATPAVYAGQRITYVLSVYNAGPSAAAAVQVIDGLPLSTTLAELDAACTAAGSSPTIVRCPAQALSLDAGAALTFTVAVTADADIPSGAVLQNRAEVTSATPDPNPANNTADANTNIAAAADFALDKSGPSSILAGDFVTYVITVTNNGPSIGVLQDIKDTLPPSLTLIAAALERAGGGLTACAGAICEAAGAVPVGEVLTMTVLAQADPLLPPGTVLANTATVFADGTTPDPLESNNQDTHTAPVTALAQIAIDKYDLIDPVYPDTLLAYVLTVFNAGPSVARDLVITDQLPAGVTYISSTGDCREEPAGVLTCQVGALPPGARGTFQVLVRVQPDVPNGALLHNAAALTSTTPLTGSILYADEDTQVVAPGGPQADLAVSKAAAPPAVRSGDLVTFTLVVTNNGPSPVGNAQALDLLPDGLSLVSVQPSQGFCNAGVNCLLGALAYMTATAAGPEVRGTATITLVVQAHNDLLIERVLTNTAYVQSELQDPIPDNNYAAAAVVLLPGDPRADVQITKAARQSVFSAGGTITYTLAVFNAGPSAAENVVVDDPLPTGVTYVSAQPAPSGGLPVAPQWQLGLVQPNERITISLVVRSDASAQAGLLIHNQATVTTTTQDPLPANNTAAADVQVFGTVDLEVSKTANPTAPLPGGLVTYTIVITNHGPSAAQDVDIKESLPPSASLVSLTPQRGVCVSQICQFGVMSAGEQIVVTATVQVDPSLPPGTVLTNTVTGFTDTPDSNPSNNQDKEPVVVGPLVNLRISKHSQTVTATVGTEITYTMIVTNYGPADSPNVVVTDIAPAGFAYLRTTNPLGCSDADRWYVVCPLGPLPARQTARLDIVFFIESVSPVSVTNRVLVNDPDAFDPEGGGQGEIVQPTDPKGPSAVTLTRFDVTPQDDGLLVTWETALEIDSWSFRLWRSTANDRSTAKLIMPEAILARGSGSTYTWLDTEVKPKTVYYYWLQEIAISGAQKEIEVAQGGIDLAPGHKLYLPCIQAQ